MWDYEAAVVHFQRGRVLRGPLVVFALALALVAGAWVWFVAAYAGDEESPPGWLLAIWFVAWGLLALSLLWAIVHLVRSRLRVHRGEGAG
jgi:DMSO reductase anchor subunit